MHNARISATSPPNMLTVQLNKFHLNKAKEHRIYFQHLKKFFAYAKFVRLLGKCNNRITIWVYDEYISHALENQDNMNLITPNASKILLSLSKQVDSRTNFWQLQRKLENLKSYPFQNLNAKTESYEKELSGRHKQSINLPWNYENWRKLKGKKQFQNPNTMLRSSGERTNT